MDSFHSSLPGHARSQSLLNSQTLPAKFFFSFIRPSWRTISPYCSVIALADPAFHQMSLLVPSSSAHARHEPLPSPPPSPTPTEEEDLARAQGWRDDAEDEERMMFSGKIKGKGKGKAREVVDLNQDDGESMGSMTPALDPADGASGYPPTTEEEEEEKKIAEVCSIVFTAICVLCLMYLLHTSSEPTAVGTG